MRRLTHPGSFVQAFCLVFFFLLCVGAKAQSFSVTASPQAVTVFPGEANVPLTISVSSATYSGPVNVTLSGLPSGITVSPLPLVVTPGGTGTITLNVGIHADQEAFPASNPANANSAANTVTVVAAVGSTVATSTFTLTVSLSNPAYVPTQVNLPIVNINTSGVAITSKTTDVPGTITITSADGTKSYLPNSSDSDNTATFHLHGNTTIEMPKKPYHVKLNTSLDLLNQMGLSCPYVTSSGKATCDKSKTYILLANYDDKTLLRDWSASALANAIPYGTPYLNETPVPSPNTGTIPTPSGTSTLMPWAPHSLFVELYLNGAYQGNYQLIEDVNVDSHRVNISELSETDTSGDLTGGYLLEIDQHQDEAFVFHTPNGLPIGLIDPDFTPDPEVPEQTSYISDYVDSAETALFSANFTDPELGWRAYFDEASAVNFYLVNDIMGNVDGGDFYSSVYLYKAIDNPFLYMGPIWDFDISSGNTNYESIENPTVPWMQTEAIWYKQWFTDPGFKADVISQFNTLKNNGVFTSWLASISQQAATLEQSQANNFNRWPMLGIMVWPNPEASDTYDDEVAYLTNYLTLRLAYLDSLFNGKTKTTTTITWPSGTLYFGAPETLVAHVTGTQSPTGIVSFFSGKVVIGSATLDSTGTATLVTSNLLLGSHTIGAVYNGDSKNALSSSSTTTITVVPPLANTVTSLASSASPLPPGASETLSVSVAGNSGSTTPTGNVTFTSNGATIATVTLTAAGTASFTTASLPNGTNTIQATYAGNTVYQGSSSNTVSVTVNPSGVPVTFGTSPAGLAYTVDGVFYNATQVLSLNAGTTHTIATFSPQDGNQEQATFTGWSDGGALSHSITVPAKAATYTATFSSEFLLSTAVSPEASGTIAASPASSNGYYTAGTVVNLTATPAAGYVFAGWTGNVANANSATTSVTMNQAQTVSANFAPNGSGIAYSGGFSTGSLSLNGSAALSGTTLELTNGKTYQAASAFYNAAMNIQSFTTDFTFQLTSPSADGFMFVLQNQSLAALGGYGDNLGFGTGTSGIQNSVGIKFDLYNNSGEGNDSTGLFIDGAFPTTPAIDLTSSGVNLHSGDVFHVHMAYDGTTLTVTITDTATGATATQSYTINIPAIVGSNAAFAGFTAGTGGESAVQQILTWTFNSGTVNYSTGFSSQSLSLNGSATLKGSQLQLTHAVYEAGSAFYAIPANVQSFTNDFTFQLPPPTSDGLMFVIQNQSLKALGGYGDNIGFGAGTSGIQKSVGIKFDLYNNNGEGNDSTGLFTDGALPTVPAVDLTSSGVNLHSGDIFHVHMTYDGATLTVTITDTVTGATATQTYTVDIPTIVGGNTAYVGFTSGTGVTATTQNVLSWTYTAGSPDIPMDSPTFSPLGGTYSASQKVTLSDAVSGAAIYYTLDGTQPTPSSTLYSTPIAISANTTVHAIAVLNGSSSSSSSASYTFGTGTNISYSSGFTSGNLSLNGSAALQDDSELQLTHGTLEAGSAFYTTAADVQSFTNDFTFQLPLPTSDGLMFVIQNQDLTALGGFGENLGFGSGTSGIQKSVGIKFDLYNNNGEGDDSTGLFTNGALPTIPAIDLTPSGVNLHSGDIFHVHMTYDGTTLTVTITDTVTGTTATQTYTVNIPAIVGGNSAYVGFTSGEGVTATTQNILSWTYTAP